MFESIDDIAMTNRDIILVDYLLMKFKSSSKSMTQENNKFALKIDKIILYLENLYAYIFKFDNNDEIFINFYKLHKEKNLDAPHKLNALTELELSVFA